MDAHVYEYYLKTSYYELFLSSILFLMDAHVYEYYFSNICNSHELSYSPELQFFIPLFFLGIDNIVSYFSSIHISIFLEQQSPSKTCLQISKDYTHII